MISFEFDAAELEGIQKGLSNLSASEGRRAYKNALNQTAKKARKLLQKKAQETYVIKAGGFNNAAKIENATAGNLEAFIKASGKRNELKQFKVSPASYASGANRPSVVRAKVVKANSLKALQKNGIKAFVGKYASGHTTVMERTSAERLPIQTLYSLAVPQMLGSEKRVYGVLKKEIEDILTEQMGKQIDRILKS